MDPSHLLWRDASIFQARYEKSAAALIAIRDALARHPGVCGGVEEFLSDYRLLTGVGVDDFTAVWKDPYAYFWMRLTFEVLGACLRGEPLPVIAREYAAKGDGEGAPAAVLEDLLRDFKRLALGARLRTGEGCRFAEPFETRLPFAIPGVPKSLLGSGRVAVHGADDSHLHLVHESKRLEVPLAPGAPRGGNAVWVEPCPVVRSHGAEILLQPHLYHLRGLGLYQRESDEGFEIQYRYAPWIEAGLEVLHRHDPGTFDQVRDMVCSLALQVREPERYTNVSHSDLPGSILIGIVPHAHYVADILVHEVHHHRLFFIEEIEPILAGMPEDLQSESHYLSPWREDLRPLHGILHGLYVYIATTRFWLRVLAAGGLDDDTESLALHKAVGGLGMLRVGAHQLRRHARFTPFGAGLFAQMEADVEALAREIGAAGLPDDPPFVLCHPEDGRIEVCRRAESGEPIGSREQLVYHVRRFAPPDQADDILRHAIPGPGAPA